MAAPWHQRLASLLAINRVVGVVLLSVLLFGLGEELWRPFLPLYLKSQTRGLAEESREVGSIAGQALFSIGIFAFLLNLFEAFCYTAGGTITARLGNRGSLQFFACMTLTGYALFLLFDHIAVTILATLLILGWESLATPVTFTTVGASLSKEQRGMAFAVQSIQKRLPRILGPAIAGFVIESFRLHYVEEIAMRHATHWLVGIAFILGMVSLAVQWRLMPNEETPSAAVPLREVFQKFPPILRRLLLAEILTRWCDWLVRELVVVYVAVERGCSPSEIGLYLALQHAVALATYLPIGQLTKRLSLKPFIGLTFVFFALFPITLLIVADGWLWLAFVVYGLREIGEPARKALITTSLPPEIRSRGVGLYWGKRTLAICWAPLAGAALWYVFGPPVLFALATGLGVLAVFVFYWAARTE